MSIKCDMCQLKDALRYGETLRKSNGNGSIVNVCDSCMVKLSKKNKANQK